MGMNRVILSGNLGQDGELRFTTGGEAVLSLRLATTEVYYDRDKQKKEHTEWHSLTIWGKRAEALSKIVGKGTGVIVEGRIRSREYEPKAGGEKRRVTEIRVDELEIVSRPRNEGGAPAEAQPREERRSHGSPPRTFEEGLGGGQAREETKPPQYQLDEPPF